MVCFIDEGILVGNAAKSVAHKHIRETIYDVKRFIGLPYASIEKDAKRVTYKVINDNGYPKICIGDAVLLPEQVSGHILKQILRLANTRLEKSIKKAVITVPAYFGASQRDATKDAAKMAGFEDVYIINEPTAAALAFQHDNGKDNERNLLIYDFGGGTFDVSIVKTKGKHCKVIAVGGDCNLGGIDITMKLFHYVKDDMEKNTGISLEAENFLFNKKRLQHYCERVKDELSGLQSYNFDFYFKGGDYNVDISRIFFENLAEDIFQETLRIVEKCISDANLTKNDIDIVVLVGGSTRIPRVKQILAEYFGNDKINTSRNPDQMVAYGAVIYAESLLGHDSVMTFEDVLSQSLGTDVEGDMLHKIIPRNTSLPVKKSFKYSTIKDYQKQMTVTIYQGESAIASENILLGQFVISNLTKAPARKVIVEISFSLNTEGTLKVQATEVDADNQKELEISLNKTNLTNFQVYSNVHEERTNAGSDKKPNTETTENRVTLETNFLPNNQKFLEKKKEFDMLHRFLLTTEDIPKEKKIAFMRKLYKYHLRIENCDESMAAPIDAIIKEITEFIKKNIS